MVAWIPEHRVLFTGDLVFNGGTPFVLMGSVAGSLVALDCVMELEPDVIVPGHGEVCGPEVVDVAGEYLRFLHRSPPRPERPGSPLSRRPARPTSGPWPALGHPERLVGNLHRAFAECEGARPGDPIDVAAALGDMVAFNGGQPLTCQA